MKVLPGAFASPPMWLAIALPMGLLAQPTLTKSFIPTSIPLNGTSVMTFDVINSSPTVTLTSVTFTDNLPAGLVIGTPVNITLVCTGGSSAVVSAGAGGSSTSLVNATLMPSSHCTFSLDVKGTAAGSITNTVATVTSSAGPGGPASAILNVAAPIPVMSFPALATFALLLAGLGWVFSKTKARAV